MPANTTLRFPTRAWTVLTLATPVLAQTTTLRVSVASNGAQADGASDHAHATPDGRWVVFDSAATNLIANDTNGFTDVFLRDTVLGTTVCVSRNSAGVQGNRSSVWPKISADGRKIFFNSDSTNLVSGDTNGALDVFAYDVATATTTRVSLTSTGGQPAGPSLLTGCSDDGRYITFGSGAFNLVPGDTNQTNDVFVRDLQTGNVIRASVTSSGAQATNFSQLPVLSGDGRLVAFISAAALVQSDANLDFDVYVHELATGITELVSVDLGGLAGSAYNWMPALSSDGHYVAFASGGSNLVAVDANGFVDVFVRDRLLGVTERCSIGAGGVEPNEASFDVAISDNGQLVAFQSSASNLVSGDTNGAADLFWRDWRNDVTQRLSVASDGSQSNGVSSWPSVGTLGRQLVFTSSASNLVANDTNGVVDVFLRREPPTSPQTFCTAGTSSSGCTATLSATAQPSVSLATPCTIQVANVEGLRTGVIFYGVDNAGFAAVPWGPSTSYLCVKSPTQRTPAQSSGGALNTCTGQLTLDWNAFRAANPAALGSPWSAGASAYLQAWFRDPPSPKTTMLSNAIELVYLP